jgi:uncharacterized protein (TIGR03435 family)
MRPGGELLARFLWLMTCPVVFAQQSNPAAFETASIKPHNPNDPRDQGLQFFPSGRLTAVEIAVRSLIAAAYELPLPSRRLSGGPNWINSEEYDIEAAAAADEFPSGLPVKDRDEKMRVMLQNLLADRFKLAIHRETKEMPVYALVVSKNGHKMRPASVQCDAAANPACRGFNSGPEPVIHGRAVSVADLTRVLERWSDRPILDQTDITGLFDIDMPLPWPLDEPDLSLPTVFTALNQIGLRLEGKKAFVEILVIDRVERPDPN